MTEAPVQDGAAEPVPAASTEAQTFVGHVQRLEDILRKETKETLLIFAAFHIVSGAYHRHMLDDTTPEDGIEKALADLRSWRKEARQVARRQSVIALHGCRVDHVARRLFIHLTA